MTVSGKEIWNDLSGKHTGHLNMTSFKVVICWSVTNSNGDILEGRIMYVYVGVLLVMLMGDSSPV